MGRGSVGVGLALLLVGCASPRAPLSFPVVARGGPASFTAADGAAVTLTAASLRLADLRLEAPSETTARVGPALVASAWAHPGHQDDGAVSAELLGAWTVDLLAGEAALGRADALEGPLATARLHLPGDVPAVLVGEAVVGEAARAFRFEVAPDQELAGLPLDGALDAAAPPARLVLEVDLAHALSFVDWGTPDADADGALTVADHPLENTVPFGLVSIPTFTLTLEP